jgi:hypothetical protein
MKKGDTIVCLNLKGIGDNVPLTIGRKYIVLSSLVKDKLVEIISDDGCENYYLINRFELLENIREEKLNKLLDI